VIVRVSTEGQYELSSEDAEALSELDNAAVSACQGGDEKQFREAFDRLLELVRARGRCLADDELVSSEMILPPPDATLEEARAEFSGEGLLPD